MTVTQASFLTSRVISLCFFYEALMNLGQIPSALMTIYMLMGTNDSAYAGALRSIARTSAAEVSHAVVQAIVDLFLGIVFYRFGLRVARFLMGGEELVPVTDAA